jgi:deoxyribodipyrimidine photo-lyase
MSLATARRSSQRLVVHWFRPGNLRLHDNPSLFKSVEDARDSGLARGNSAKRDECCLIPIFCFDTRVFGAHALTESGNLKCGPRRAKFLIECVADLRVRLRVLMKLPLAVVLGEPVKVFGQFLSQIPDETHVSIFCQEEVSRDESEQVATVRLLLRKRPKGTVYPVWGSNVHDPRHIHFGRFLEDLPDDCNHYPHAVQKRAPPLPKHILLNPDPAQFPDSDSFEYRALYGVTTPNFMPSLSDLGYTSEQIKEADAVDPRSSLQCRGGETNALNHIETYIWEKDLLKTYSYTRNHLLGIDHSTKLSSWLSAGCLSPRHFVAEMRRFQSKRHRNLAVDLYNQLLRRDHCKFLVAKYRERVFSRKGTSDRFRPWSRAKVNYEAWKQGRTGYPLVDACMRELSATGYMSGRGRLVVASFFSFELGLDWRLGAEWFQSQLVDYDVYSNWVVREYLHVGPQIDICLDVLTATDLMRRRTGVHQQV